MNLRFSGKWLRLVLVGAAVVVLAVAVVLPWGGPNPQSVLARTYEAIAGIQSYRLICSGTATMEDGATSSYRMEVEFAAPDRYHLSTMGDNEPAQEYIIIGDMQYATDSGHSQMVVMASTGFSSFLTRETTLDLLDKLIELRNLPDEKIEGIDCFHYIGKWDMEKQVEEIKSSLQEGKDRPYISDVEMEKLYEPLRAMEIEHELWIGKDDYLIRQMKTEQRGPIDEVGAFSVSMTMKFLDFNAPITIAPPLDENGDLLPGWRLANPLPPEAGGKVFAMSIIGTIGVQEGYDDWAHQEVEYSISITNISAETVRDIRVTITSLFADENNKPAVVEAEPETPGTDLAPGESRRYHARLPFDASHYTKEEIIELEGLTTVLVHFTSEDGEELTELLHPNAPYPTSTPPPDPSGQP